MSPYLFIFLLAISFVLPYPVSLLLKKVSLNPKTPNYITKILYPFAFYVSLMPSFLIYLAISNQWHEAAIAIVIYAMIFAPKKEHNLTDFSSKSLNLESLEDIQSPMRLQTQTLLRTQSPAIAIKNLHNRFRLPIKQAEAITHHIAKLAQTN